MKVLHISTSDIQGGAARAAFRLHRALCDCARDSAMFVAQKCSLDPSVFTYAPEPRFPKRIERAVRREWVRRSLIRYASTRPTGFEHFRDDRTEHRGEVIRQLPGADVINLHWIAGFVDYQSFLPQVTRSCPIVWTLHDMNPFTGGCHFDASCGRYLKACGRCPQLGSSEERDLSHLVWRRKKRAFSTTMPGRLALVAPSHWLAEEAGRSSILKDFPITVIPNGIDTNLFRPMPNVERLRAALGIPEKTRVLLFLAEEIDNRRKGFALLNQALNELVSREGLFLLSLGKGTAVTTSRIPHLHLGVISNDVLLATLYSLADLFVAPSIQDNLPNTVLEAMACGTPVVAFDTGGIRDMVLDGETGFLVPVENTEALGRALCEAFNDEARLARMGRACRSLVARRFALDLQADRYCRLYETLLDKFAQAPRFAKQPSRR